MGHDPVLIGRSEGTLLLCRDRYISGRHAEIYRDAEQQYHVRDLGSRSGTRVNGEFASDRLICVGDVVEMGETRIEINARTRFSGDNRTTSEELVGRRPFRVRLLILAALGVLAVLAYLVPMPTGNARRSGSSKAAVFEIALNESLDAAKNERDLANFEAAVEICVALQRKRSDLSEEAARLQKECEQLRNQFNLADDLEKKYVNPFESQCEWKRIYYSLGKDDALRTWIWENKILHSTIRKGR
jgi:hypothetical protein